jgi:hypothetical protein
LLEVPYFHVVLTLPRIFNPIALANPQEVYVEVAADPKHLGAEIGVRAVLHTWGQNLELHPHVHGVVPGGGLSPDGTRFVSSRPNFFLPVRVLSRVFRGKFLAGLRTAFAAGRLRFPGKLASLAEPEPFHRLLSEAVGTEWVVYTQPHLGSSEVVLKYLARYTHRAAISNHRLLELKDGQVHFCGKDYARGGRWRTMTLSAIEFVRRFLMHVLPSGFVRIRHYGILANRHRKEKRARCRELLNLAGLPESDEPEPIEPPRLAALVTPTRVCPVCGAGRMIVIEEFPPRAPGQEVPGGTDPCVILDSS